MDDFVVLARISMRDTLLGVCLVSSHMQAMHSSPPFIYRSFLGSHKPLPPFLLSPIHTQEDGTFLFASLDIQRIFGRHPSELIGTNILRFLQSEDAREFLACTRQPSSCLLKCTTGALLWLDTQTARICPRLLIAIDFVDKLKNKSDKSILRNYPWVKAPSKYGRQDHVLTMDRPLHWFTSYEASLVETESDEDFDRIVSPCRSGINSSIFAEEPRDDDEGLRPEYSFADIFEFIDLGGNDRENISKAGNCGSRHGSALFQECLPSRSSMRVFDDATKGVSLEKQRFFCRQEASQPVTDDWDWFLELDSNTVIA